LGDNGVRQCTQIYTFCHRYKITVILAILWFLVLGWVGALGGAILRGTDHEPIAKWIVETFGDQSWYETKMKNRKSQQQR
jgi:hypothetical protein